MQAVQRFADGRKTAPIAPLEKLQAQRLARRDLSRDEIAPQQPIDALGEGDVLGIPFSLLVAAIIALAWHVVLSRMRPGWRLTAVGGARRSAYNAGIKVRRTVFFAYVWSGLLCSIAGFLFAARLGSTGADTGPW